MALKANSDLFVIRIASADHPDHIVGYAVTREIEMIPAGQSSAYGRESLADFERLFANAATTYAALPYHGEQDDGGHYVAFAAGSPSGPGN